MKAITVSVKEMYEGSEQNYKAFLAALDQSLNPRSPDVLYEKFNKLLPNRQGIVLDIGCRYAAQACELAQRFGYRVVGIDLVHDNIQNAQKRIVGKELGRSVQVIQGDIQRLPFLGKTFDAIWCRDVLTHTLDLYQVFRSCARVLKANGKMMTFQTFATDLLSSEESLQLCLALASSPENMSQAYFEKAFSSAGFSLIEADVLGSEWREYGEETESKVTSKQLLRIARLRRNRERLIAEFGEKSYASEMANCHWGVYQMLGKLNPTVYTLTKSG